MTFWPFSSSSFFLFPKKTLRSEFGNNKAGDTFSPDAKITVKGLPFYSLLRTQRSPQPFTQNVYAAETCMHLSGKDY